MRIELPTFDYKKITNYEDSKKDLNFSYMQSLTIIGAYLASQNKESTDLRIFASDKSKFR